jgi:hypothetical protein
VPTEPVKIDLPSLNATDTAKESHKDFYKIEQDKAVLEENEEEKESLL